VNNSWKIGRSGKKSQILLADDSVSGLHAEIVVLDDGRLYVSDCNSMNGSYILKDGQWVVFSQTYLRQGDDVRFGNYTISCDELYKMIKNENHTMPGRYERNPNTGEVIKVNK